MLIEKYIFNKCTPGGWHLKTQTKLPTTPLKHVEAQHVSSYVLRKQRLHEGMQISRLSWGGKRILFELIYIGKKLSNAVQIFIYCVIVDSDWCKEDLERESRKRVHHEDMGGEDFFWGYKRCIKSSIWLEGKGSMLDSFQEVFWVLIWKKKVRSRS